MGGFAGGDEAGYWDEDTTYTSKNNKSSNKKENSYIQRCESGYSIKAHAKVNIFLKITAYQDDHCTLLSRVVRIEDIYDTISFIPCTCRTFTIDGCDNIPLESNSIYKAYRALIDSTLDSDVEEFFESHKVVVTKRISQNSGLGGSSSDAAAFILLVKEVCNLILNTDELAKIGSSIGTYVPFFIYNYPSANVSGSGSSFSGWEKLDSKSILEQILDPIILNDLYSASITVYPELKREAKEDYYLSGSTFFKLLN